MSTQITVTTECTEIDTEWSAEIYRDWEFPEEVIAWWQRASDLQGDIGLFVSPGWLEQWWAGWGTPGKLFTVVLRKLGRIKGIFPCYVDQAKNGEQVIRSLAVEVYHDLLADDDAIAAFVRLIELKFSWFHVHLEYLSTASASRITQAFRKRRFPTWVYTEQFAPYIDLDKTWDTYLASLNHTFISELRKKRRRAERDATVTLEVHRDSEGLEERLTEALEIEASGWKGREGTAIKQIPKQERFVRLACRWAAEHGKLWLVSLRLDGKMVAFDINFENAGTIFDLKTGFDEDYPKYSPGHLMHFEFFKTGFETGAFRRFNFLGKFDSWKQNWAKETGTCQWVFVYPRTLSGRSQYLWRHAWKEPLKRSTMARRLVEMIRSQRSEH